MKTIKKFIARNFESFTFFYRFLRYRIFIALILSILVGILDGLGISMFLPLLQLVDENGTVDPGELGNLRFIVDGIESLGLKLNLIIILSFMVIFFTMKGILQFLSQAYRTIVQQSFIRNLRIDLLKSLNNIRFKYFVMSDIGRIQNTMTGEVQRIAVAYQTYFRAYEQIVLVIVYMGFAFFVDAQFAILITIGGILTNFLFKIIYKQTKGASRNLTAHSHVFQGQVVQHIANYKYLKATGTHDVFGNRLLQSIDKIERSNRKIGILSGIFMGAREPLLIMVVAIVMVIQTMVLDQPLGPILISLLFFYRALTALMSVQSSYNNFLAVSGSLENITSFKQELAEQSEPLGKGNFERLKQGLSLRDVSFLYNGKPVLENINLSIIKNETIAFVGESGSGKTTLVNILAGLMPVDKGDVLIDNVKREDLDVTTYQKRIGYITQEPVIFNDTIFNNITFWDEPTNDNIERFNNALKKAAIYDFVMQLSDGSQTQLGNNGINLSGGQKQRISIARELYKEIDILIMDEATSALDSETESAIQQNIDSLKGQFTILIIAHRLSTIRNADRIILLKDGKIEQEGSFEELINTAQGFKKMVELQEL